MLILLLHPCFFFIMRTTNLLSIFQHFKIKIKSLFWCPWSSWADISFVFHHQSKGIVFDWLFVVSVGFDVWLTPAHYRLYLLDCLWYITKVNNTQKSWAALLFDLSEELSNGERKQKMIIFMFYIDVRTICHRYYFNVWTAVDRELSSQKRLIYP